MGFSSVLLPRVAGVNVNRLTSTISKHGRCETVILPVWNACFNPLPLNTRALTTSTTTTTTTTSRHFNPARYISNGFHTLTHANNVLLSYKSSVLSTTPLRAASSKSPDSKVKDEEELVVIGPKEDLLLRQMQIRLMNENGYLSWVRNGVVSSILGVSIMNSGIGIVDVGGCVALTFGAMNVFWGTGSHMVNLHRLRHVAGLSREHYYLQVGGALMHCGMWAAMLVFFLIGGGGGFLVKNLKSGDGKDVKDEL